MTSQTLGIVGMGRMGGGIAERLRRAGHTVVGWDRHPEKADVTTLDELVAALPSPRMVWLMVPAGEVTEQLIQDVTPLLAEGDILIDGGNSYYKDSMRRADEAARAGVRYLDIGVSGGIWGLEEGFCLMAGGPRDAFDAIEPMLEALAPPDGYRYIGPSGSGHFVKMVHNGIEYGLMQAYAEGFDLLHRSRFDIDLEGVANLWNNGSVVRSWLLELAANALADDPALERLQGYVEDSGEGRWTVLEAVEQGTDASVLSQALFKRFTSRQDNPFAMRMLAALRNEFGGHAVRER